MTEAAALIDAYTYADVSAARAFERIARQGQSRLTQLEIMQGLHNGYFMPRYQKTLKANNV
jgi:hypothetical protein